MHPSLLPFARDDPCPYCMYGQCSAPDDLPIQVPESGINVECHTSTEKTQTTFKTNRACNDRACCEAAEPAKSKRPRPVRGPIRANGPLPARTQAAEGPYREPRPARCQSLLMARRPKVEEATVPTVITVGAKVKLATVRRP